MNFHIKPFTLVLVFLPFLAIAQSDYINFKSVEGAFSVDLPSKPAKKYLTRQIPLEEIMETLPLHIFQSTDVKNNVSYLVRYHDMTIRGIIFDFDTVIEEQIGALQEIWGKPTVTAKKTEEDGFPAQRLVFKVKNIDVFVKIILRGKRMYLLMAEVASKNKKGIDISHFFESFDFLPFEKTPLQKTQLSDTERILSFPNNYLIDTISEVEYPELSDYDFTSIDTLNGITYSANFIEYSPYYESEEGDSFLIKAYQKVCSSDELKSCQDTIFQEKAAIYFQYDYDSLGMSMHNLIFSKGNYVIELSVLQPLEFDAKSVWEFFNSYLDNTDYPDGCFLTDRTDYLLQDLQSTDTVLRNQAKLEIYNHVFNQNELMGIYQVLEADLPEDNSGNYTVRELLIQELGNFTFDISTFPFLKKLYGKKTTSSRERLLILEAFANYRSIDSFTSLFELVTDWKQTTNEEIDGTDVFYPLVDTLDLTLQFYPQLLEMKAHPIFQEEVLNVIYQLKVGEKIPQTQFDEQRNFYVDATENIIQKNNLNVPLDTFPKIAEYGQLKVLIRLLSELSNDEKIEKILISLNDLPDEYLQVSIIDALLMHGLKPSKSSYQFVAKSPYYWYDLLKDLKFENRLEAAPKTLRTPELMVESAVTNYLTKEYGPLKSFEILGKEDYLYQGKTFDLYRFKFSVINYTGNYFGVCSQPGNGKSNVFPELFDYSTIELTEGDANLEEIFQGIINGFKE